MDHTMSGEALFCISLPTNAGGGTHTVEVAAFPPHILYSLAQHGLQQKVADAAANAKAKDWSESTTHEKCMAVIANLKAGTWGKHGGGRPARTLAEFIAAESLKAAQARIKADARLKNQDPVRVAKALAAKPELIEAWTAAWEAQQAKRAAQAVAAESLSDEDLDAILA